jgi:hypothetical protein
MHIAQRRAAHFFSCTPENDDFGNVCPQRLHNGIDAVHFFSSCVNLL